MRWRWRTTPTSCASREKCSARFRVFPCCSRITSTPATKCKPAPAHSRSSVNPRKKTPPLPQTCAQAVPSFLEKPIFPSGQTFARSNRSVVGRAAVVKPTTPTASTVTLAARVPARQQLLRGTLPQSRLVLRLTVASFARRDPTTRWSIRRIGSSPTLKGSFCRE